MYTESKTPSQDIYNFNNWFHSLGRKLHQHLWLRTDTNFHRTWREPLTVCETAANLSQKGEKLVFRSSSVTVCYIVIRLMLHVCQADPALIARSKHTVTFCKIIHQLRSTVRQSGSSGAERYSQEVCAGSGWGRMHTGITSSNRETISCSRPTRSHSPWQKRQRSRQRNRESPLQQTSSLTAFHWPRQGRSTSPLLVTYRLFTIIISRVGLT